MFTNCLHKDVLEEVSENPQNRRICRQRLYTYPSWLGPSTLKLCYRHATFNNHSKL